MFSPLARQVIDPVMNRRRRRHRANQNRDISLVNFPTPEIYNFQKNLHIILNARFRCTFSIVHLDQSKSTVEFARPTLVGYKPLCRFIDNIGCEHTHTLPEGLDLVEEQFFQVLHFFHDRDIFFPVSTKNIEITLPTHRGPAYPRLFLPLCRLSRDIKLAAHKKDLRSTWKARSFFRFAKVLLRIDAYLSSDSSPRPIVLDLESQHALIYGIRRNPNADNLILCEYVAPMIPELACAVVYAPRFYNSGHRARNVSYEFFGGPMPLPEPGTPPDAIYDCFVQLRARVDHSRYRDENTAWDPKLENNLHLDSIITFLRLFWCRAAVAMTLGEPNRKRWIDTAKALLNASLAYDGLPTDLGKRPGCKEYQFQNDGRVSM
ncbi:hypothetical protein F4818DRAFT_454192 [Hypoxylon cercidicola]|nr:hypothetical protein F4818DRAFT_454192 [Hypoxylon cercidicola]